MSCPAYTVAVSGLNGGGNPGPGLGIARSLKEAHGDGVKIIGLSYGPSEAGAYLSHYFDAAFVVPSPQIDDEYYFERLGLIQECEGLDIVIPCLDAEFPFFYSYGSRLAERGIRVELPDQAAYKLRSKEHLPSLAKRLGLQTPPTKVVHCEAQLDEACREFGYPLMVKGRYYNSYRALSFEQALGYFRLIAAEWGAPVLVQKPVGAGSKGGGNLNEINLAGLGDGEGNLLAQVSMKKVSVTSMGKMSSCVTIRNDSLLSAAKTLCEDIKWKGPFEIECIEEGGELYLIEINPRFPSWIYLSAAVGINMPDLFMGLCCGEESSAAQLCHDTGVYFVRHMSELVTDFTQFQNMVTDGTLRPRERQIVERDTEAIGGVL